jgi:hypothetical protein
MGEGACPLTVMIMIMIMIMIMMGLEVLVPFSSWRMGLLSRLDVSPATLLS